MSVRRSGTCRLRNARCCCGWRAAGSSECGSCWRKTRSTIRPTAAAIVPTACCWRRWQRVDTYAGWWRASRALAPRGTQPICDELAARAVTPESSAGGVVVFRRAGVEAHVVTDRPNLRAYFSAQIAAFRPDVILASTDDPAQLLLEVSVRSRSAHGLPGARAAGFAVRSGLRLPQRGQNGRAAADRRGGGGEPVRGRLRPPVERHSGRIRADLAAGPAALSGAGPLRKRIRHAGESVRGEGYFHLSGISGSHARSTVRGRANVGHDADRSRGASQPSQYHAARSGG